MVKIILFSLCIAFVTYIYPKWVICLSQNNRKLLDIHMFGLTIIAVIGEKCVVLHCGNLRSRTSWLYSHLTNDGSALHASSAVWPELPTPAADYYLCNVSQYTVTSASIEYCGLFVKPIWGILLSGQFEITNFWRVLRDCKYYYSESNRGRASFICLKFELRISVHISKAEAPTIEL